MIATLRPKCLTHGLESPFPLSPTDSGFRYHGSLMTLFSRLLVSKTADPGSLNMHSLIQSTLEKRLTLAEQQFYFEVALQVINKNFPTQDHGERLTDRWELCNRMLPHVLRLHHLHRKFGCSASLHDSYIFGDLLERTAWYISLKAPRYIN